MYSIKTEMKLECSKFLSCSSVVNNLLTIISLASLGSEGLLFSLRWTFLTLLVYLAVEDSFTRNVSFYLWIPLTFLVCVSTALHTKILHQTTGVTNSKGLFVSIILCMVIPLVLFGLNILLIMITGKNQLGFADIVLLVPVTLFNGLGTIQTGHVEVFLVASLIIFVFVTSIANLIQCILQFLVYKALIFRYKNSVKLEKVSSVKTPVTETSYRKQLSEKLLRVPLVVSLTVGTFASYLLGITL